MAQIEAFSLQAYKHVLASDFFNPSNCELRKIDEKTSIKEAIGTNCDLFDSVEKTDPAHKRGKPLRFLARSVAVVVVGVVIAPAGTLWNGGKMVVSIVTLIYHKVTPMQPGVDIKGDWQKVWGYSKAFFTDLVLAGFLAASFAYLTIPGLSLFEKIAGSCFFAAFPILPMAGDPKSSVLMLTFTKERLAVYKSICLRNDFGIVGQNSGLLPYNTAIDQETERFDGHLGRVFVAQGYKILTQIREMQLRLPEDRRLPFELSHFSSGQNLHLRQIYAEGLDRHDVLDRGFFDVWIRQFDKNCKDLERMKTLLGKCIEIKTDSLFCEKKYKHIMPEFPLRPEFSKQFFDARRAAAAISPLDSWKSFLDTVILQLLPDDHPDYANYRNADYLRFKKGVREKLSPYQLLEVADNANEDAITKAYRTKSLAVHPNRVMQNNAAGLYAEANCLFQSLERARELALAHA